MGRWWCLVTRKPLPCYRAFREAISTAQSRRAKFFELKAVMSLSRLLREQERIDEARKLLSDIYSWFSEGFESPDLKQAKAFLDGLG